MQSGPSNTFIAHKAISLCEDLSGSEKRVAAAIVDHFNRKTGQCDPGLASIAKLVGVSERTVIRAVTSLAKKGYVQKHRHGGKFHRNQYEPNWDRFREMEAQWNAKRSKKASQSETTDLSLLQRQSCHGGGDIDVTQTLPRNSTNETLRVQQPARESCTTESVLTTEGPGKEVSSKESYETADKRFLVKTGSSHVAARDAAERRWNEAFTKQLLASPDVFGSLVEAIDVELSEATTDAELRKRGSGILFLLRELDRRFPLIAGRQSTGGSALLSAEVGISRGSERRGSPGGPELPSLNTQQTNPIRDGRGGG